MPDWKTYAKAARNTARKQAPGAAEAAQRSARDLGEKASGYARAAGKAAGGQERPDRTERPRSSESRGSEPRTTGTTTRDQGTPTAARSTTGGTSSNTRPSTANPSTTSGSGGDWRKDAAAYATVAQRRLRTAQGQAQQADLGGRILRALRDALLIGGSILVIWLVLHTAGIMIPFTVMLAIVLVIVIISFGAGVFGQMRKARQQAAAPPPQG